MRNITFILILINLFSSCSSKEDSELGGFVLYSYPSFYSGFKIEVNNNTKKVTVLIPYEYSLADSISAKTWKFIDSTDLASIKKLLPKDNKFETKPTELEFEKLKNELQKLSKIKSHKIPPEDGITICLKTKSTKNKISKSIFYSPNELSESGKIITNIYSITSSIYKENTKVEDAIENSQRYFNSPILVLKSTNPLYVKFLDDNCDELEHEIDKLPFSKTIFVDLTNFHKDKDKCLEKIIRKKYSKIKWILKANENYGFAE